MKECIRCGAPLEEGDQFCKKCGAITNVVKEENSKFEQSANNDFNNFGKSVIETQVPKEEKNEENIKEETQTKVNEANNNKNKIFIAIIGMLIVILIGMVIFVAMTVMGEKEDEDEPKNKTSKNTTSERKENSSKNELEDEEDDDDEDENDKNNTISKPKNNNEIIEFAGYELTLPESLENVEYEIVKQDGQDVLVFEDSILAWSATITEVDDIDFKEFKENIDDLEAIFASVGITVENIENEDYYGIDVISLENKSDDDEEKMLIALAKTSDGKVFEIDIYCDYIYDYFTLRNITGMLSESEYTGKTSTSQSGKKDDFEDLEEELKTKTIDLKKVQEKLKTK